MDDILDFSKETNVALLDQVAEALYSNAVPGPQQQRAQQLLTSFQEHPDAWQRVPTIIAETKNQQNKFLGLIILDKLVTTRWKTLPEDQRQGIKNFVINTTLSVAGDDTNLRSNRIFLGKLNLLLVQILKQEWPHNWPTFIPEIVTSSRTSLTLCENNMVILRLLSEEIFDYSAETMTQHKIKTLKESLSGEFTEVFQLCLEVLEKAQNQSLIQATLNTLLRFLNWIPLGYIFETSIIDQLLTRFLEPPAYRNITLKCLSEIAGLNVSSSYDPQFIVLFTLVMTAVNKMIPPSTDIAKAYVQSTDEDQELILNLALFLSNFLSNHLTCIETPQHQDVLLNAHLYMIKISQVEEREVFKICLEYWSKLVKGLYDELQSSPIGELMGLQVGASPGLLGVPLRKNVYSQVLSELRLVMIEKMVKPEEVLIVENDEGEVVREFLKESDTIVLYKAMREVLVYLTHLDVQDTESILLEKLSKQVDGTEWSWANINTLCWAIGSISGAMTEETEKRFLVTVIKDLLGLTEMKKGKDNKAIVASNIMYIVGQYPRFLKAHWKFLKTVVNKLFEFMHETHEGVQDMACDTFIKIAMKCRRHFIIQQANEVEPFIDEILRTLHRITVDLSPAQVHTFYEAVGYMIAQQPNKPVQEKLIAKLMEMPNGAWDSLMAQAGSGVDILGSDENLKILANVLKTNVSAATSLEQAFTPQLGRIYMDMLGLYRVASTAINQGVAQHGPVATKTPRVRALRTIKKEILKLMDVYIRKSENENARKTDESKAQIATLMPPLFEAVLDDYSRNTPGARESEVLNLMTTIVSFLRDLLTPQMPAILDAVFECTLQMISQDFTEYPEHRVGFFKMMRAIDVYCFSALLTVPPTQFKLIIDSLAWAIKHTMRDIADIGLNTILEMITNFIAQEPAIANSFFQMYFTRIEQEIFFVLTDTDHKSGFKLQSSVLQLMFQLIETGRITAPLFDPATTPGVSTNAEYLELFTSKLLKDAFPHLLPKQIEDCVKGLRLYHNDGVKFKLVLRDFLIQLKEFAGDTSELFLDEHEDEKARKAAEERATAERVPGMLKPSEQADMDDDL